MTVQAIRESRKIIQHSALVNPIAFDQLVEASTHILVYADSAQLTPGVHYNVTDLGDAAGATVTLTATALADYEPDNWIIIHEPPMDQQADLGAGGGFGLPYENALDAIVRRMQTLQDQLDRAVMVAPHTPLGSDQRLLPDYEAGRFIGWDDELEVLRNIPSVEESTARAEAAAEAAIAAAASMSRYQTVAAAEAAPDPGFVPDFMEVLGTSEAGDGRMMFTDPVAVDPGDTVNNIFVPAVSRWYRLAHEEGVVNFGRHAMALDGSEETSTFEDALAVALDAGLSRMRMDGGKSVELVDARIPEGTFEIDFQGSTVLGNFNSNVAGATDRILRADLMRDGGTLIGDMTGNGGLAAGMPGAFVQTASDNVTIIGTGHATTTAAARAGATNGYIGKSYPSARRIYRATVYGTNNAGYLSGSNPSVTITLYGKTGAAPASGTDGTVLGSVTFTDTNNESATPREIVSSNQTAAYDHAWIYVSGAAGTNVYVAALQIDGVSPIHDLTLINPVFDGRYNNTITLVNERTGIDIWGYRNVRLLGGKITGFGRGGLTPRIIFNRDVHHTRIHNCLNVVVDSFVQDANAAGEEIIISSTDQTTQYLIQNCRTINKLSSGSSISVAYCGPGRVVHNYVQSTTGSCFNILSRNAEVAYNDVFTSGSHAIDMSEGLIYSHGSWVHHNVIRAAEDACITGAGNGLRIENNLFTGNGTWGVNTQNALNGTGNYGSWQDMVEHDIVGMKIKGNRSLAGFNESPSGYVTNANVKVVGNSGAEYHGIEIDVVDSAYPTTKTDQNIWLRRVASAKIRGKLMHGQEALVRIDQQCGVIELDHVTMQPEPGLNTIGVAIVDANVDCVIINNSDATAFDVGAEHVIVSGTGTLDRLIINNSPTIGVESGGAGGLDVGSAIVTRDYGHQLTPQMFGVTDRTGLTSSQTAVAAAVAAAYATDAEIYWPAGTFLTTASIPNFHDVQHRGPGIIKRGTDNYYVWPKLAQTNNLYVATTGNNANDGLTSSQPFLTVQKACDVIAEFAPRVPGRWVINVAAGTYTENVTFDSRTDSEYPIYIKGPTVASPGVPTAIIAAAITSSDVLSFDLDGHFVVQYIKLQGATTAKGLSTNQAKVSCTNLHVSTCLSGVFAQNQADITLTGGILTGRGTGVAGGIGFNDPFNCTHTLAGGVRITAYERGGLFHEGSQGHLDDSVFDANGTGINVKRGCGALNTSAVTVSNNAVGILCENNQWFNNGITFTGNTVNVQTLGNSPELVLLTSTNAARTMRQMISTNIANHTGTVAETDLWTSTSVPAWVYGNAGHTHTVKVFGTCVTAAAITLRLKIDNGTTTTTLATLTLPIGATSYYVEFTASFLSGTGWRSGARGDVNGATITPNYTAATSGTVLNTATTMRVSAQLGNAADGILFGKLIWDSTVGG